MVALAHCMFHHPIPPPLPPRLWSSVGGPWVRFHLTFNHFPTSRPDHPGVPGSPGSPLLHPPGCWYESLKVFRVGLYPLLTCWKLKVRTRQRCQVLFIRSWLVAAPVLAVILACPDTFERWRPFWENASWVMSGKSFVLARTLQLVPYSTVLALRASLDPSGLAQLSISSISAATNFTMSSRKVFYLWACPWLWYYSCLAVSVITRHSAVWLKPCTVLTGAGPQSTVCSWWHWSSTLTAQSWRSNRQSSCNDRSPLVQAVCTPKPSLLARNPTRTLWGSF